MKVRGKGALERLSVSAAALAVGLLLSSAARACPMCFNGNNTNQSAFLYGSLFLMIVPVIAIGSLLYWAYRRSKSLEAPPDSPPAASGESEPAALRLVRR